MSTKELRRHGIVRKGNFTLPSTLNRRELNCPAARDANIGEYREESRMYKYDAFHKVIDELIELNLLHRKEFEKELRLFSPIEFFREFGTIHCDIGRRTGKTEYIKKRAKKHDLVIVRTYRMTKELYGDIKDKTNISSAEQAIDYSRGKRFERIFIDEPGMMGKEMIDSFYKYIGHSDYKDQIFILLGR